MCGILVELSPVFRSSQGYSVLVGKVIRRTITITVSTTETLTIMWTPQDEPVCQVTPVVQVQLKTQEKQDETIE